MALQSVDGEVGGHNLLYSVEAVAESDRPDELAESFQHSDAFNARVTVAVEDF